MWTFSIYLEAVAIMPQLFMLSRTGSAETITAHYLFALGSYRYVIRRFEDICSMLLFNLDFLIMSSAASHMLLSYFILFIL